MRADCPHTDLEAPQSGAGLQRRPSDRYRLEATARSSVAMICLLEVGVSCFFGLASSADGRVISALPQLRSISAVFVASAPTALLHVGPHKTGTTHIQNALVKYKDRLLRENIVWSIPRRMGNFEGLQVAPAHHFMFRCLRHSCRDDDEPRTDRLLKAFDAARKKGKHIIISSEVAGNLAVPACRVLKEMLNMFSVRVVYTYRELLSWLYSDYRQLLWTRNTRSVFSAFSVTRARQLRSQLFESVSNYVEVFGRSSVTILDYLGACHDGDIVNAVLSAGRFPTLPEVMLHDQRGLPHDEVLFRQLWGVLDQHLMREKQCSLQWPANPLSFLTSLPEVVFNSSDIPVICKDVAHLKNLSLSIDAKFRQQFADCILHGRPDLVEQSIAESGFICEVDIAQITGPFWNSQFERQMQTLPADACVPGVIQPKGWQAHGRL